MFKAIPILLIFVLATLNLFSMCCMAFSHTANLVFSVLLLFISFSWLIFYNIFSRNFIYKTSLIFPE